MVSNGTIKALRANTEFEQVYLLEVLFDGLL